MTNSFARRQLKVRNLILDYALGAAIVTLLPLPFPLMGVLKLVVLVFLNVKLVRDVGRLWGFPKGIRLFAIIGNVLGFLGAIAIAFLAWGTVVALSAIASLLSVLAPATAVFSYFWSIGQTTNHFYLSSPQLQLAESQIARPSSSEPSSGSTI